MRARVFCLDSSQGRLNELSVRLEGAGWEVWRGRDVRDLLLVGTRLQFGAALADEASVLDYPELWEQVQDVMPNMPLLVHSLVSQHVHHNPGNCRIVGIAGRSPEVVLTMVTLLMESSVPLDRAAA